MLGEARLPVTITLEPGEAIDGYLERLAAANEITRPRMVNRIRGAGATTAFLAIAPDVELVTKVAILGGIPRTTVVAGTLASLPGIDTAGLDPRRGATWRNVAARGWPPEYGSVLCPACFATDGIWRVSWRHPWVTVCTRHATWLLGSCPTCSRRFRTHRTPLRPVDAPDSTCGNPVCSRGRNCPQVLADLHGEPAPSAVLISQRRIDTALARQRVQMLGELVEARAYLPELKALAVLLLHLAAQPGGDNLVPWAVAARADRERTGGYRGARWALAPPADLQLRGRALADSDAVLSAATLETAANALHAWTELTPPTNDGQLGWLASHTTMTPVLTRLVMSSTAARRRVATLLDHRATRVVPVTAIPQVVPRELYAAVLAGVLDVTDRTGRLFASLCLARRHTAARTWSEAATAIGLPAELGMKVARACSANLLLRADRFVTALDDVAEQLGARVDYRSREAAVRRLALRKAWYQRWARIHHRGSRATSRGHAVTWLWTEYAHGHIDTSPSWPCLPDRADRARYRSYVVRLSPAAATGLVEIATPTGSPTTMDGARN